MPKPVYATADELADAVKKLEGQAASELAAATRSSRRLRRSHQCTGMIGMIGLSGEGGLVKTEGALQNGKQSWNIESHIEIQGRLTVPEPPEGPDAFCAKSNVSSAHGVSDGLGQLVLEPLPDWAPAQPAQRRQLKQTEAKLGQALKRLGRSQAAKRSSETTLKGDLQKANDQMASNASTATEGIARCGSDSKTYTDDRLNQFRGEMVGLLKGTEDKLMQAQSNLSQKVENVDSDVRKALADELAALCERIDKEFLTTREDARLRGLRGLIDAMKMDVDMTKFAETKSQEGKANLSDQRSQLDTAMAEAAKEVEQKLDQLQAAMEKTLKDGRKPRSRGRIGGHTDMPYGDFNEEQGKAQGLRDEKQQRAESEIWLKLDRTSELLQEPWAVLQDVLQGVLQLGDETNQNLEDYKTEANGRLDGIDQEGVDQSGEFAHQLAGKLRGPPIQRTWVWLGGWPNAPNGQREFGWLSGMNSLQPSWEANEEEAADGGQSAFMFSPKFDMAGVAVCEPFARVHGLQLELQLFSERRMESFVGYGKIAHGTCKGPEESEWCVTEKATARAAPVHGANFSVHVDRAGRMKCAKRKGFLEVEVLESSGADYVALFGELCGGKYPHTEVREVPFARPVQVGVWYSPCIEFILFDIAVFTGPRSHFMAFKSVADLAKKHALHTVPLLFVGSRGECANYDPKFLSRVPEMLGLPRLSSENWAEGIVAKIWDQTSPMERRPIFKIKIQEFQEGEGSAPSTGDPSMKTYLLSQVNENRILSAASKVGPADDAGHWEEITDLVIQDIRDDVGDDPTFLALEDQLRCATYDMLAEAIPSS
ncbi:RNA-editing ligase 2 [Durusdinium trenchii]|uniref:Mitochondrial n=1 Tax=Durusdinium trenchii TaxID=1381693 RepID=A0ABP0ITQ4_9DINO